MNRHPLRPVGRAIATMLLVAPPALALAQTAAPAEATLEEVKIVNARENRVSSGATGLDMDIKETPQSISVVTSEQMRDFGTTNINDALRLTTGIQVEEWETNRTTYTVRGFDVANTQVDGIGMPNSWGIVTGALDSFGYEKIELIRGANGLLTGVGNAAGTINYVRKRPTNKDEGSIGISYGSWNTKRVEADYSKRLTEDGRWAGRVVFAREEGKSHLRGNEKERTFLYGVVDGQVGDNGMLTAGLSHQQDNSNGVMWGALYFGNSDGTQAQWPRNASTTQDWTKWDTTTQNAFVEYAHQLGTDWQLKASYNYRRIATDTKLFYAYLSGLTTGLDPATGYGLAGYAGRGEDERNEHLGEISLNGRFTAFGRQHEALIGAGWARAKYDYDGYTSDCSASAAYDPYGYGCTYLLMPSFPYAGNLIAEPVWGGVSTSAYDLADLTEQRKRVFGSTRLTLTDRLKSILGFNWAQYSRKGNSFGTAANQDDAKLSLYAGLTYDITPQVLAYVSYSDLYMPQSQVDTSNNYLAPSKGSNIEAGVKADWLDKRLLTTVAVFQAKQSGLATPTGTYNQYGQYVYEPQDVKSTGVEFEAVGKVNKNLDVAAGYTALKLTGPDGSNTYSWVPRRTANLALRARLPSNPALSFGASARWQSKISNEESSGITVRQGSYAVLNAFVAWQVQPKTTLRLNVNNVTNEKYINTLRYAGYYGAPRSYQISLNHQF
ncbi:MAG: TonB-dependent siderophore receptor [Acidovorax sp.]|uniref:TonB-dependent siderophore receptor n=1 Tax=Acidovorax sp. TaxID=1872122 RepID=UPI0039E4F8CD